MHTSTDSNAVAKPGQSSVPEVADDLRLISAMPGSFILLSGAGPDEVSSCLDKAADAGGDKRVFVLSHSVGSLREIYEALDRHPARESVFLYHGGVRNLRTELPLSFTGALLSSEDELLPARDLLRTGAVVIAPRLNRDVPGYEQADRIGDHVVLRYTGRPLTCRDLDLDTWRFTAAQVWNRIVRESSTQDAATPTADITAAARRQLMSGSLQRGESGSAPWPYVRSHAFDAPPASLPGGAAWPRISVVTPSFNSGAFIEETILSVLHQNYPNLEFIVMDGASTDNTMDVANRYRDRITHLVSEKDRGQTHALNKGFGLATGEILTWLNADDMFAPGALFSMALAFHHSGTDLVAGVCQILRDGAIREEHITSIPSGTFSAGDVLDIENQWLLGRFVYQPEMFFSRPIWEKCGAMLDESLHYVMDYDFWTRCARASATVAVIGAPIAIFRIHKDQKTFTPEAYKGELREVCLRHRRELGLGAIPSASQKRAGSIAVLLQPEHHAAKQLRAFADAAAHAGQQVTLLSLPEGVPPNEAVLRSLRKITPDIVVAAVDTNTSLLKAASREYTTFIVGATENRRTAAIPEFISSFPEVQQSLEISLPVEVQLRHTRVLEASGNADRMTCRNILGLPTDQLLVLLPPGDLSDESSGVPEILRALRFLGPPDTLALLPSKPSDAFTADEVIVCSGWDQPERRGLYCAAADMAVIPRNLGDHWEMVVLSAAAGTPVISIDDGKLVAPGISGLCFSADDRLSLAAELFKCISQPLLRSEIGFWARLWYALQFTPAIAANEIFQLLHRAAGDRIAPNLVLPVAKSVPAELSITDTLTITPVSGLGRKEGPYEELGLPEFRWAFGPSATFTLTAVVSGPAILVLRVRNQQLSQRIRVSYNGILVGVYDVAMHAEVPEDRVIVAPVIVDKGENNFELQFSVWEKSADPERRRALMLLSAMLVDQEATVQGLS